MTKVTATLVLALFAVGAISKVKASDEPGQHFVLLPPELPSPHATPAADNGAALIPRHEGVIPVAPPGFVVEPYVTGLSNPRFMALAPNGDIFLAESYANKITLLHNRIATTFAAGFHYPHGVAFHDGALYVGDLEAVWRVGYNQKAGIEASRVAITRDSFGGAGFHITRDIVFGRDGTLYVAIGSANNVAEEPLPRATVQTVSPDGHLHTFAGGLRNPVGLSFFPNTDLLYITAVERDGLGDGLPPDFFTQIRRGDFFGWPYAYTGPHPDPDYGTKRPDLVRITKTPDVLFPAHSTPLGLVFYEAHQFPSAYRGNAFIALHGSWNSAKPAGYKVVMVRFHNGRPEPGYENFVTGFWTSGSSPPQIYGRPAGLLVDKDGSLLIADDAGKMVWRVRYVGR